ncbi:MAG: amino acid transporter [Rubellimicrobium sp.]|nr:amino acid transporter [Rubellimicrobium sp.]
MAAFASGFGIALSLIMAVGAQNAFVLRQGIRGEHVFAVALMCAASDGVLIAAGVGGFGVLVEQVPWLGAVMRWGGAAFLLVYGARAFLSAWRGGASLEAGNGGRQGLGAVLATCFALTWLNPHVYLDTVVLIGSVSRGWPGQGLAFGTGAALASFTFFFSLALGARALAPLFARPSAWRVLDVIVGVVMWTVAAALILKG